MPYWTRIVAFLAKTSFRVTVGPSQMVIQKLQKRDTQWHLLAEAIPAIICSLNEI